jgi:DNA polymerase-3 subunit epsilon
MVRPRGWTIPLAASAIHLIDDAKAERLGVERVSAIQVFGEMLDSADLLIAHNIKFDQSVMETNFHRELITYPQNKNTFCTMLAATPIVAIPGARGGYKWPRLNECIKHFFDEDLEGAHDALVDVIACRRVYHKLVELGHG